MKKVRPIVCVFVAVSVMASAQSKYSQSESARESFADFRRGLLEDYNRFRSSILENYDEFLQSAWDDYQQMRGVDRYESPKPHVAPVISSDGAKPASPAIIPQPDAKADEPSVVPNVADENQTPADVTPPRDAGQYSFAFYGMDMKITDRELKMGRRLSSTNDFADQWRSFSGEKAENLIPAIRELASSLGLNDYLTFRLVRDYIAARYPQAHTTVRVALEHYLLCHMGYDVRLAMDDRGMPLLLIPFSRQVYARPFLMVGSRKYYVYQPDGMDTRQDARISTCRLPADTDAGRPMDLRIDALRLPDKPREFNLSFGGITLTGQVNENLMNVVYRYPQMDTEDFAVSQLSPDLRADLVRQLRQQLSGLDKREAVDRLLQFTQSAFEYATDEDFHGFEKPYFLEEMLYYPKCDCEDRSIFYTYMLWNVLGVENHLLAYPGHESAAVRLSAPVDGDSYEWKGATYYISDPTYIGSVTGMCMPMYTRVRPNIDHVYK